MNEQEKLIEIYSDESNDNFDVGYIVKEFNDWILFESVSQIGAFSTYQIYSKKFITSLVEEDEYLEKLKFYTNYNKDRKLYDLFQLQLDLKNINEFTDIFNINFLGKQIVTIASNSSEYLLTGKIQSISSDAITIKITDGESGHPTEVVLVEDIIAIDINSVENFLLDKFLTEKK